jgi:hypothetical protein
MSDELTESTERSLPYVSSTLTRKQPPRGGYACWTGTHPASTTFVDDVIGAGDGHRRMRSAISDGR